LLARIPVVKECLPTSPSLRRLIQGDAELAALPCLSLISSGDHFVKDAASEGFAASTHELFDSAGHLGALFDPKVIGRILEFLKQTSPPLQRSAPPPPEQTQSSESSAVTAPPPPQR